MTESDGVKLNRLINAVADGYTDCLDGIYEIAGGRMFSAALGLVRNRAAAEDVLQESFIKIVRFAKSYRADNPYGWLMKIVRNTAYDYLRKTKVHPEVSTDEIFNLTSLDYSPERRENAIMLEQAIATLDGNEKKVIYFTYYLDMTVREIAAELKCGKSTVQRTLAAAEKKLKIFLDNGTNE